MTQPPDGNNGGNFNNPNAPRRGGGSGGGGGGGAGDANSAGIGFRVPPHSNEAEASLLGSILLDNSAIDLVLDMLTPEDFYQEANRKLFTVMREMYGEGKAIDTTTVFARLAESQSMEAVGGVHYVLNLTNRVPSASNIEHYAEIVRDKGLLRRLIYLATQVSEQAYHEVEDVPLFLDTVERQIFSLSQQQTRQNVVPMSEIIKETFRQIEQLHEKKDKITGVSTGFLELDDLTAGFQPSDLIILAARPSMGKTAFSLGIMAHAALRVQCPVAYFSLEMSKEQLAMRLLCSEAQVDASRLRGGFLNDGEWRRLIEAAGKIASAPIYIDDTAAMPIMKMQAVSRRLKTEKNIGMIMVDYLQLMRADALGKNASREQIVSEISRNLKAIAKELRVPVVALSQLNRGLESRTDKRPLNSDLRESGSIEQDADVIMFIYRDEVYNKESEEKGIAEIIISKQRNGPLGTARLKWVSGFTRFDNLAREEGGVPDF